MAISDRNIVITPNTSVAGATQPKIVFTGADSSIGDSAAITLFANPENSGTLSFSGSQGQLFSVTNNLSGTIFAVGDISGIPSLEIDDAGIVKIAEYNGRVLVGGATDDSSSELQVSGTVKSDIFISSDSSIFGGNGSTGGVKIDDGAITIRTGTGSVAYIDLYCEVSNAHRVRLKSPAHADYSGNVDIVLPTASGTLLNTDGSGASLTALNGSQVTSGTIAAARIGELPTSKITSGTFDSARLPAGAFGGGGGGVDVQDEGSALSTTGTVLNFVGAGVVASGTGATKTITIAGGGSGITVQDEGSALATSGTTLNFVGSGVVASGTGATKTITISGGGGGGGITAADSIIRSFIFG